MENKSFKILAIVALCVAVAGLSVAYAALSQSLNINASAKAGASSSNWNINFKNGQCSKTGGAIVGNITTTGTSVTVTESTFTAPGDTVTCTFDVVNDGTIDAKVSSITIPAVTALTYTGSGAAKETDETLVKGNMEYSVTYSDNSPIQTNDTLTAKETKNLKLTLKYKDEAVALPVADVSITNINATLVYEQA